MTNLAQTLLPQLDRPVVLGDYPYYRAAPGRWADNLRELRRAGVDVVTSYLPWRLHEYRDGTQYRYDFTGQRDAQHDVCGYLRLVAEAGLAAVLKPGPFIHAEVQLGGLPDRLCGAGAGQVVRGLSGAELTSQGQALPSLHEEAMRAEVRHWLAQVSSQVLEPFSRANGGPVIGVQLGNEGCYGEIHLPIDRQDAGPGALAGFAGWLAATGLATDTPTPERIRQDPALGAAWAQWCGLDIAACWRWLSDQLPAGLVRLVNVPFAAPGLPSQPAPALAGWAARQPALRLGDVRLGHTEWIGNPARDPRILAAHCFQQLFNGSDVVETNWGFTWTDESFADPATPLFSGLLALLLGSSTCSVYTACATQSWGPLVDLDPDGLRSEGFDPAHYGPPYCPGAPTREDGTAGATRPALDTLAELIRQHGAELLRSQLAVHGTVEVEPAVWHGDDGTVVGRLLDTVAGRLFEESAVIVPVLAGAEPRLATGTCPSISIRPENADRLVDLVRALPVEAGTERWRAVLGQPALLIRRTAEGAEFAGIFNPGSDPVAVRSRGTEPVTVHVPAHSAALVISRNRAPVAVVSAVPRGGGQVRLQARDEDLSLDGGCGIRPLAIPVPA